MFSKNIKSSDIHQLKEGTYFGEALFVGWIELCMNMNKVSLECQKQSLGQLDGVPGWASSYQDMC